jgi:transcriptional regulator with XRE-family HTH domain
MEAGLTQRALGERAGIVGKYVSEIERGTRDVPLSTLLAIVERGLQLQLEVVFRAPGATGRELDVVRTALEDLMQSIVDLPTQQQQRVIALLRGIVELVR